MDKYRIYNDRGISQMGNVRVTVETSTSSMMEQRRDASSNAFRDLTNASVLSTPLTHKAVALAHHPRPGPSQSTATPITPQSARKRAGPKQANGRYKYGYRALQEIRHLQKTTNNLIPKMSFARLVKAIAMRVSHVQDLRWNVAAMAACQEPPLTEYCIYHYAKLL
ncbi:unnamed protein product, partial [Mesorhabditis spiculigera]